MFSSVTEADSVIGKSEEIFLLLPETPHKMQWEDPYTFTKGEIEQFKVSFSWHLISLYNNAINNLGEQGPVKQIWF